MALRAALRAEVADKIEAEAAKERQEVGLGCAILYVREDPRDIDSAIVAYRITVTSDNGLSHTFADVPASKRPTEDEILDLVQQYQTDFVEAIKARRAERKTEPVRERK